MKQLLIALYVLCGVSMCLALDQRINPPLRAYEWPVVTVLWPAVLTAIATSKLIKGEPHVERHERFAI